MIQQMAASSNIQILINLWHTAHGPISLRPFWMGPNPYIRGGTRGDTEKIDFFYPYHYNVACLEIRHYNFISPASTPSVSDLEVVLDKIWVKH
jgi:hypothetical protein